MAEALQAPVTIAQDDLQARVAAAVAVAQSAIGSKDRRALEAALFNLSSMSAEHSDAAAAMGSVQGAIAEAQSTGAQMEEMAKAIVSEAVRQEIISEKRGGEILASFPSMQLDVADQLKAVHAETLVTGPEQVKAEKSAEPGQQPLDNVTEPDTALKALIAKTLAAASATHVKSTGTFVKRTAPVEGQSAVASR